MTSFGIEKCAPEVGPDDAASLSDRVAHHLPDDRTERSSCRTSNQKSDDCSRETQSSAKEGHFAFQLLGLVLFGLHLIGHLPWIPSLAV